MLERVKRPPVSSDWSYKVKQVSDSVSLVTLFAEGKKIGLLYNIGNEARAEEKARLIIAAPKMYTLLSKLLYRSELDDWAIDEIEQLFAKIDGGGQDVELQDKAD